MVKLFVIPYSLPIPLSLRKCWGEVFRYYSRSKALFDAYPLFQPLQTFHQLLNCRVQLLP